MWSQLCLGGPGSSLGVLGFQCYAENVVDPGQCWEVGSLVVDSGQCFSDFGPGLQIWV